MNTAATELIREGDNVIIYEGLDRMQEIVLERGKIHQNRFGAFHHEDIIGKPWGSKVVARRSQKFTYALRPSPELWAMCCQHRTQILYSTDIGMIGLGLDLRPGKVVVESGTGSGVLSHSIARSIMPTGHLYTFEFHRQRAEGAANDFRRHGLSPYITVIHRDVGAEGFAKPKPDAPSIVPATVKGVGEPLPSTARTDTPPNEYADAVFLDLPSPHEAMAHAWRALKPEGKLCSFSPCIEQVQRCCLAMAQCGFVDIRTIEALLRPFEVRRILPDCDTWWPGPEANTIPSPAAAKKVGSSADEKKQHGNAGEGDAGVAAIEAEPTREAAVRKGGTQKGGRGGTRGGGGTRGRGGRCTREDAEGDGEDDDHGDEERNADESVRAEDVHVGTKHARPTGDAGCYLTFARKPPGLGPAGVPASRASIPGMSPDASITTGVTSSPAATAFAAPASSGVSLVPVAATATPTSPAIAPVSPATGPAAALAVVSLLRPRPLSTDTPAPHVPPTAATMVALAAAAPPARRASSVPALGAMLPTQQQQTSSYHK